MPHISCHVTAAGVCRKIRRGQPDGGRFVATVHARTLKRAAEICGGEQQLALWLRVTPSHLARWIEGLAQPPTEVFLRAVDLVVDHSISLLPVKRSAPPVTPETSPIGSETTAK
jgi:hypothetical protein